VSTICRLRGIPRIGSPVSRRGQSVLWNTADSREECGSACHRAKAARDPVSISSRRIQRMLVVSRWVQTVQTSRRSELHLAPSVLLPPPPDPFSLLLSSYLLLRTPSLSFCPLTSSHLLFLIKGWVSLTREAIDAVVARCPADPRGLALRIHFG
jgi:hypothetical protein